MSNSHSRRSFLKLLMMGGGAAAIGGLNPLIQLAQAESSSQPPRYFVFVYFSGGWDILLSLDPRDPAYFNDETKGKTQIEPGYDLLETPPSTGPYPIMRDGMMLGPYVGELARHSQRLAIVRGMSMDTLTHEVGRRRFITGKPPSGLAARGSSIPTWLSSKLGSGELIPNLAAKVEAYNNSGLPNFATALKISSVNDLLRVLRPGADGLPDKLQQQVDALQKELSMCDNATRSALWQAAEESRESMQEMLKSQKSALFDFQANTTEMKAIRDRFVFPTSGDIMGSPEAQAAMAAQALTNGLSRCVSFQANVSTLDHHFVEWATDHGPTQMRGFNAVARLVDELSARSHPNGGSWMDYTTIVGFSEFSRTAMLNASVGRDHSLTNACFLLGAGIKGATVVGRSSDLGMAPYGIDLVTGEPSEFADLVRPENVLRTLFYVAGIKEDIADLRVEPIYALLS